MHYPPLPGLSAGGLHKTAAQRVRMIDTDGEHVGLPIEDVRIGYELIGAIALPSGRIVVADMYGVNDTPPQLRSVAPGSYDCQVLTATFPDASKRIAMAVLRLTKTPVVKFVSALREGEEPTNEPGGCAAVGIDSWVVCVGDAQLSGTSWATDPRQNDALDKRISNQLACIHTPPERPDLPFLLSRCGHGDGCYAVMWGLDARGKVACLLVDSDLVRWDLSQPA